MNALLQLLIHFGWYKVTVKDIREWSATRKVALLKIALRKSNYKIRKEAAKALGLLKDISAIEALYKAAFDEVQTVARESRNSIIQIMTHDGAEKYLLRIDKYWAEEDQKAEGWENYHKSRKIYIPRSERVLDKSKMKMLAKVKGELKKPIGMGFYG